MAPAKTATAKPAPKATPDKSAPTKASDPKRFEPPKGKPFRRSDIPMNDPTTGDKIKNVCQWLKQNGLRAPTKKIRVTATKTGSKAPSLKPREYEAVDVSAAINEFVTEHKVKNASRYRFRGVVLEE